MNTWGKFQDNVQGISNEDATSRLWPKLHSCLAKAGNLHDKGALNSLKVSEEREGGAVRGGKRLPQAQRQGLLDSLNQFEFPQSPSGWYSLGKTGRHVDCFLF